MHSCRPWHSPFALLRALRYRFACKTAVLPFCRTLKARRGLPDFESSAFDHSGAAASGARVIALVPV